MFDKKPPLHFFIGIMMITAFWFLNWELEGLRTYVLFVPLWVGYALTVDALVFMRKGTSLLTRSTGKYITLFFVSAIAWWLFELMNEMVQNWYYYGKEHFTDAEYAVYATFSFSTVIPAVFGTAELVGTFNFFKKLKSGRIISFNRTLALLLIVFGILQIALIYFFPRYTYPLVWSSVFFIIDPLNYLLGRRSLIAIVSKGMWKPAAVLSVGCLITGFFWEMWNYYSYPKWIYDVPFVDFLHIFEMPLIGFLGYIPFSLELFALYHFVTGFFGVKKFKEYLDF